MSKKNTINVFKPGQITADKDASSGGGATVAELKALFESIDADGSGAIDAGEMQEALELMGIHLSDENMVRTGRKRNQ